MAKKKKKDEGSSGAPAWMATYGDMVTLLLCFFVLLFSMSSVDVAKFKAAMSSFADQIDVFPGGETLTEGEMLNNGISQLNDIQVVFQGGMALNTPGDSTAPTGEDDNENDEINENSEAYELAGKIAEEFQDMIEQEGFQATVAVSYTSNYVKFTLQGEFLFDSGQARLKAQAVEAIGVIAGILQDEEYNDYDIQIEGHTDNLSINNAQFPNNWILSSYRAYAVLEELLTKYGFDPGKIAATGYGEYRPIADNTTVEGRALNRRVEIKVVLNTDEVYVGSQTDAESETSVGSQTETTTEEESTTSQEPVSE